MPNMNCTRFELALEEAVENRVVADAAELRQHAATCSACRALWEHYAVLEQAIPRWSRKLPTVDLADRVLSRLSGRPTGTASAANELALAAPHVKTANDSTRRRARQWTFRTAAAILTASAALLLMLWLNPREGQVGPAQVPIAQSNPANAETNETVKPSEDTAIADVPTQAEPRTLVREAGSAYLGLAEEAVTAVAVALPTTMFYVPAPTSVVPTDGPRENWVKDWGNDLKPIGDNVSKAFGFLIDAVPVVESPAG